MKIKYLFLGKPVRGAAIELGPGLGRTRSGRRRRRLAANLVRARVMR